MPISDDQMNTLMQNITENIPTNCSAYDDIHRKSNYATIKLGINEFNISDYQAYRNDIEFVNSFSDQVRVDEKQYFLNKYSQKVYDFLLTQRLEYIAQENINKKTTLCGSDGGGSDGNNKGDGTCPPNTCNNPNHKTCTEDTHFLEYIINQTKSTATRPETTYKKIEYRNEAHELLDTMNYLLTLFYFAILILMLILLAATNRLKIRERFMLYLFLFIIPFVFPYLFEGIKYLYRYLFPDSPNRGPQNAFVESL